MKQVIKFGLRKTTNGLREELTNFEYSHKTSGLRTIMLS